MSLPHHSLMPETGEHAPSFERAGLPPYATPVAHGGPQSANERGRGRGPGPYVPAAWRVRREPVMEVLAVAELDSVTAHEVVDADVVDVAVEGATIEVVDAAAGETVVEAAGDASDDSLPWIDAFLATTPAGSMDAIPDPADAVTEVADVAETGLAAGFESDIEAGFAGDFAADVEADIEADIEAGERLPDPTDTLEPIEAAGQSEAVEATDAPPAPVDEWPLEEAASNSTCWRTSSRRSRRRRPPNRQRCLLNPTRRSRFRCGAMTTWWTSCRSGSRCSRRAVSPRWVLRPPTGMAAPKRRPMRWSFWRAGSERVSCRCRDTNPAWAMRQHWSPRWQRCWA